MIMKSRQVAKCCPDLGFLASATTCLRGVTSNPHMLGVGMPNARERICKGTLPLAGLRRQPRAALSARNQPHVPPLLQNPQSLPSSTCPAISACHPFDAKLGQQCPLTSCNVDSAQFAQTGHSDPQFQGCIAIHTQGMRRNSKSRHCNPV